MEKSLSMKGPFIVWVKTDEPFKKDPDPESNCVFLDNDGLYYRVDPMPYHETLENELEEADGWEIKRAIRARINGRVMELLRPAKK